jgi:transcriptional regulator with XRE-family HTH domain
MMATQSLATAWEAAHDADMEWRLRIADYRRGRGLTQAELGAKADMSQSRIARIESGKLNANVDQIARIARELGVTVSEIVGDADALPDRPTPAELDLLRIARRIGIEAALDRILLVEGREVEDVTDGTILRGDHPARPVAGRERRA